MSGRLGIPPFDGQSSMRRPDYHSENNDLLKIAHIAEIVRLNAGACRFSSAIGFKNGGRRDEKL
jgi:hypothetical protein